MPYAQLNNVFWLPNNDSNPTNSDNWVNFALYNLENLSFVKNYTGRNVP